MSYHDETPREYELAMRQADEEQQYYDYVDTESEMRVKEIDARYEDNPRNAGTMHVDRDIFYRMAEIAGYTTKCDADGVFFFMFKMTLITYRP